MVFSSSLFLLYFLPLFLLVYYLADTRYKNAVILFQNEWSANYFNETNKNTPLSAFNLDTGNPTDNIRDHDVHKHAVLVVDVHYISRYINW